MSYPQFTVVIPLYNKVHQIEATLRSVIAQRYQPLEIIVVDDGSTDGSAEKVEAIPSPLIHLVSQPNQGVCVARNRGILLARGSHVVFLDADDQWKEDFLAEQAALIGDFPEAGLYTTAFEIQSREGIFPAPCPKTRGLVEHFFRDSAHRYIAIPSTACIPRSVFEQVGLFPEGMKIGEDLYMWILIARRYRVCFSPKILCRYSRCAENRSASSYTPEKTKYSFEDLYDPTADEDDREFVARAALGKALVQCIKGGTDEARRAARFFSYTKVYRRTLLKVRWLCRMPRPWRAQVMNLYDWLAWKIAKKGL